MRSALFVFLGAGIGGVLRHLVGLAALRWLGPGFPWGTLFVNVAGAALIAAIAGFFATRNFGGPELRLFLATGVCGGFTTWSTFSLDVVTLWERGRPAAALGYVAASLVLSFAVLTTVLMLARR